MFPSCRQRMHCWPNRRNTASRHCWYSGLSRKPMTAAHGTNHPQSPCGTDSQTRANLPPRISGVKRFGGLPGQTPVRADVLPARADTSARGSADVRSSEPPQVKPAELSPKLVATLWRADPNQCPRPLPSCQPSRVPPFDGHPNALRARQPARRRLRAPRCVTSCRGDYAITL